MDVRAEGEQRGPFLTSKAAVCTVGKLQTQEKNFASLISNSYRKKKMLTWQDIVSKLFSRPSGVVTDATGNTQ